MELNASEPTRVGVHCVPDCLNASYCRNRCAGKTHQDEKDLDERLRSVLEDIVEPLGEKLLGYKKNPQLWITFPTGIFLRLRVNTGISTQLERKF